MKVTEYTAKLSGSMRFIEFTVQKLGEFLQVARISAIRPNEKGEGYHAYVTIQWDEEVPKC